MYDLDVVGQTAGVHATGDIDRVAPDVVLRLESADHTGYCRTVVQSCTPYQY